MKKLLPLLFLAACDCEDMPETYKGAELQYTFTDSGTPCGFYTNQNCDYTVCLVDCEWVAVDWGCM